MHHNIVFLPQDDKTLHLLAAQVISLIAHNWKKETFY